MPQIRVQTCNSRVVLVLALALALQIATPPRVGPTHTLPFIGYLPAIAAAAATALPLTVTKGIANVSSVVQKSPNIVAWAQHKTNIDMDTGIW